MKYQDYIDLGFTRTELEDHVEFRQTGYGGYFLSIEVSAKLFLEVASGELDAPRLYIRKPEEGACHVIKVTPEAVRNLLT